MLYEENRANFDWQTVERMFYQLSQQVLGQRDLECPQEALV
jgi:hypothetical protein